MGNKVHILGICGLNTYGEICSIYFICGKCWFEDTVRVVNVVRIFVLTAWSNRIIGRVKSEGFR